MAEPIQKAPCAQENAIAGPWLKGSYPAQIVRKGAQKRGASGSPTTIGVETMNRSGATRRACWSAD